MDKKTANPPVAERKPLGRPVSKSIIRVIIDPALTITSPKIEVPKKEVADRVRDIKVNGYTIVKNKYTRHILPTSILEVTVKDL